MAKKKKDWQRIGNPFMINRKEGIPGLPIVKKQKTETHDVSGNQSETAFSPSEKSSKINIPNNTKKSKVVPAYLIKPNLQFPGTEKAAPVDITIGFDMGTSWTKVVIQDTSGSRALAVPFKEYGSKDNSFLLPTQIGLSDENITLCKFDDAYHICSDLKISLMEKPKTINSLASEKGINATGCELAATFIALVLRYIRNWFIESQFDVYRNNLLRWSLNLGIPVKNYDDKETKEAFLKAALAGWWLSETMGPVTITAAKQALKKVQDPTFQPGINREFINVVPEVAAEVAGYAYSDLREEGLHLLIDIGATTLDVSTFMLNKKDGEDRYAFLSAEIGRYGTFELHRARMTGFRSFMDKWWTKIEGMTEFLEPVPDNCDSYLPLKSDIPYFDNDFIDKAERPIKKVISQTKIKRGGISKAWDEGLPLFLCGGGSMAKFYSDKLVYNVEHSLNTIKWKGFRLKQIPKPEHLVAEGLRSNEYHRLAVAYGLSFQFDNIGRIIPPSDIPDIPPDLPVKSYEDQYISKEMT